MWAFGITLRVSSIDLEVTPRRGSGVEVFRRKSVCALAIHLLWAAFLASPRPRGHMRNGGAA